MGITEMKLLLLDTPSARALSKDLRNDNSPYLKSRRAILALYLGASASLGLISLYQLGLIKHLPEPRLPRLNAEAVNSSPEAYSILSMPDGVLGIASYAATLALVAMGPSDRARRYPVLPLAMTAKICVDAANAARLAMKEWKKQASFCSWCLLAVGATLAAVPLALPEGKAAFRRLKQRP
jgi:uncharacterized membrane protein